MNNLLVKMYGADLTHIDDRTTTQMTPSIAMDITQFQHAVGTVATLYTSEAVTMPQRHARTATAARNLLALDAAQRHVPEHSFERMLSEQALSGTEYEPGSCHRAYLRAASARGCTSVESTCDVLGVTIALRRDFGPNHTDNRLSYFAFSDNAVSRKARSTLLLRQPSKYEFVGAPRKFAQAVAGVAEVNLARCRAVASEANIELGIGWTPDEVTAASTTIMEHIAKVTGEPA